MPWEKAFNETDVLERAMLAFWTQGYEATSMSDLVAATGINRGSIYTAFTSKRKLFLQALRHYDRLYRKDYLEHVAQTQSPKEAITAVFEEAARRPRKHAIPGGCLLVNTALELSPHDPEVRAFIDASFKAVEDFFFRMIEAGKREGTVAQAISSRETAQALLGLFLGLRVLTRAKPRRAAIEAIVSQARAMLE